MVEAFGEEGAKLIARRSVETALNHACGQTRERNKPEDPRITQTERDMRLVTITVSQYYADMVKRDLPDSAETMILTYMTDLLNRELGLSPAPHARLDGPDATL